MKNINPIKMSEIDKLIYEVEFSDKGDVEVKVMQVYKMKQTSGKKSTLRAIYIFQHVGKNRWEMKGEPEYRKLRDRMDGEFPDGSVFPEHAKLVAENFLRQMVQCVRRKK